MCACVRAWFLFNDYYYFVGLLAMFRSLSAVINCCRRCLHHFVVPMFSLGLALSCRRVHHLCIIIIEYLLFLPFCSPFFLKLFLRFQISKKDCIDIMLWKLNCTNVRNTIWIKLFRIDSVPAVCVDWCVWMYSSATNHTSLFIPCLLNHLKVWDRISCLS